MPQAQITKLATGQATAADLAAFQDTFVTTRGENSVTITYELARIKKGFDVMTLERFPGGVCVTKVVSGRGAPRTVKLLIPRELVSMFLEEVAGLVEADDTALGQPVPAVEHVAPRSMIELHPAGGGLE